MNRCGSKLCDTEVHARPSELLQQCYPGRVLVPHREKNRDLYRFPDRGADCIHCVLASIPERTQLPDLQDEADAHDHTPRGAHQDQKCGQGLAELELYHSGPEEEFEQL